MIYIVQTYSNAGTTVDRVIFRSEEHVDENDAVFDRVEIWSCNRHVHSSCNLVRFPAFLRPFLFETHRDPLSSITETTKPLIGLAC